MREQDQKTFSGFMQQLASESDRGLALIGGAFIDEKLAESLKAFFCEDTDLVYGKNAPLGTFSARIEMCSALALIEDIERHDCDYIRKVRNEFAHQVATSSFEEQKIYDLCKNFKSEIPQPETPQKLSGRFLFQTVVVSMASRLFYRPDYVKLERRDKKVWFDPENIRWRKTADELPPNGASVIAAWVR